MSLGTPGAVMYSHTQVDIIDLRIVELMAGQKGARLAS